MNISHTPGPWRVSEIFEGHIYSNGLLIGEANNQLIHRHANARLMAAAPKLLEACKAVRFDILDRPTPHVRIETLKKVQTAIAEAEKNKGDEGE